MVWIEYIEDFESNSGKTLTFYNLYGKLIINNLLEKIKVLCPQRKENRDEN